MPAQFSTSTDVGAVLGTHTWGYHNVEPSNPTQLGNGIGHVDSNADLTTILTSDQITLHLICQGNGFRADFSDAGARATIHFLVPEFSSISTVGTKNTFASYEGWFLTDKLGQAVADGPVPAGEYIFMAQTRIDRLTSKDWPTEINVTLTVNTPEPSALGLAASLLFLCRTRGWRSRQRR